MAPGKRVLVGVYDAVGGPSRSGKDEAGNSFGPTDKGTYVVAYCQKHTSPSLYRKWSSIPWGARLRDRRGTLQVYLDGRWQPLHNFTPATRDEIITYHAILYGRWTLPDRWVFNDFGHQTCYFFKDINHNRKLDGKESIHPEFVLAASFRGIGRKYHLWSKRLN